MNIQVDPTSSNFASAMLNSKIGPRAVVGYGVKIFHPSPPNYVTRSPGEERLRKETVAATETNGFHVKAENKRFTTAEFRCHHNRKLKISASQSVCQTTSNK